MKTRHALATTFLAGLAFLGAPGVAFGHATSWGPPAISHSPPGTQQAGQSLAIDAQIVTEGYTVSSATLFYRQTGAMSFTSVAMTNPSGNAYRGVIPAASVTTPSMDYYIEATDSMATPPAQTTATYTVSIATTASDTTPPTILHTLNHANGDPVQAGDPVPIWLAGAPIPIEALISDQSAIASTTLFYRATAQTTFVALPMSGNAQGVFWAEIPAGAVGPPQLEYYLSATDAAAPSNTGIAPAGAPSSLFLIEIQGTAPPPPADITPPAITHTPIANAPAGSGLGITVTVTDASGVGAVTLLYRPIGPANFTTASMSSNGGGSFSAVIEAASMNPPGVEYYVLASDVAAQPNSESLPLGAPSSVFTVAVAPSNASDTTPPTIAHTPVTAGDAGLAINLEVSASDASGLDGVTLYHRRVGAASFDSVVMSNIGGDNFVGTIPGTAIVEPAIEYYLSAIDRAAPSNLATVPRGAPSSLLTISISAQPPTPTGDNEGPTVLHVPPATAQLPGQSVTLIAEASDPSGVETVKVHVIGTELLMTRERGTDEFRVVLPGLMIQEPSIEYYLSAVDGSGNVSLRPRTAPASIYSFDVSSSAHPDEQGSELNGGCACTAKEDRRASMLAVGIMLLALRILRRTRR